VDIDMFSDYIQAALKQAKYEILDNGSYVATVEPLPGVIATGKTIEDCREDLIEAIEEWVTIRLQRGLDIPSVDGLTIGVSREPMAVV
jgi:predicted RNase H-like HicB family nuclease